MSAAAAPIASVINRSGDLFPFFGAEDQQADPTQWQEDEPGYDPPPPAAASGLAIVPRKSLRAHIEGVDAIADAIEQLDDDALTPEVRDELSRALIEAIAGTKKKVDSACSVLAMFEHLESAAKIECDRLAKRAEHFARQKQRLEDYLLAVLEASKLDKIDGETSTIARRLNPPSVIIDDASELPREFLRYAAPPPPAPDKAAIKKALVAKRAVPGCKLAQTARLVRS